MNRKAHKWPSLLFLWTAVTAPPFAWLTAFSLFLALTNHACPQVPKLSVGFIGIAGVALAALTAVSAFMFRSHLLQLSRDETQDRPESVSRARFMIEMTIGLGLMFTLLIAVSTLPVLWLSGCPT
jgi:hypothetical protein